jgi:dihydropteroate synthase
LAYNVLVLATSPPLTGRDERADRMFLVRLEGVPARHAGRLAGLMSRSGGRARLAPDRSRPGPGRGGRGGRVVVLEGTGASLSRCAGLAIADEESRVVGEELSEALRHATGRPPALRLARGRLALGRTLVMGILNVTPDSFSDGGRFTDPRRAVEQGLRMAEEGADLIDVGGESTRPGAAPVPLAEELRRVMPVLERLVAALGKRRAPRPLISIDTTKAEVARRAAAAGAGLINDISGMTFDAAMPAVAAETGLPVVIQHIRGRPRTMQRSPRYRHLLPEIAAFLRSRVALAIRAGVPEDRIVVDPGIGFGKRRPDNLKILRHLAALRSLGRPILVGASRKSFIGGVEELPVSERLEGSLAAEALAIAGGADIIRAHDVRPAVRVARLCDAVFRGGPAGR